LKQYKRRFKEVELVDPEFLEALYTSKSGSRSFGRHAQRKAQQLCRQVQRALNLALAESDVISGISDVFVDEVSPAPDCGRLLVRVLIPAGRPIADAMDAIRREAPRLRAETAKSITRKRAPELTFAPAFPEGGTDE
jgi:ribosome-binding factor A